MVPELGPEACNATLQLSRNKVKLVFKSGGGDKPLLFDDGKTIVFAGVMCGNMRRGHNVHEGGGGPETILGSPDQIIPGRQIQAIEFTKEQGLDLPVESFVVAVDGVIDSKI
jgi:hypothetical protein